MKIFRPSAIVVCLTLAVACLAAASDTRAKRGRMDRPLKITAVPWGPTQAEFDAAKSRAENTPALKSALKNNRYRFISLEYLSTETDNKKPPARYRITYYDYTNDEVYLAESDFAAKEPVVVRRAVFQPGVGVEEIKAAIELIAADTEFGPLYRDHKVDASPAMPPFSIVGGRRYINIGLRDRLTGGYRVVGVGFRDNTVIRYEGDAPPASRAGPESCGIPWAMQSYTSNGTPGQLQLTVSDGTSPLWEMLITRPSASSGNPFSRSGVEIQNLKYKGKLVMKRGHVPVLNVEYTANLCGPYRDWLWQEGMFNAPEAGASDPASGFRILADGQVATTSHETGSDTGNFLGVAIYRQVTEHGQEVVLVSEMEAGWYRYIMEWRFAQDGTIRPRFGFGAVENPCVCNVHTHHAYWRFDFDVVNSNNKVFQIERGGRFMSPILTETKRPRSYQTNRTIVVQNAGGDEAVAIVPNLTDGIADAFAGGDFWILRFQGTAAMPNEIDDPGTTEAINIDPFVNGESLDSQDVVVWYGGHSIHNDDAGRVNPDRSPEILAGPHLIGPDIRLIRW